MHKLILFFTALIILVTSCNKNKVEPEDPKGPGVVQPTEAKDYFPMKTGNYWVYERWEIDTAGNETLRGIDSTYIAAEKIINGNIYFEYNDVIGNKFWVRDSGAYLKHNNGDTMFITENQFDTFAHHNDPGILRYYNVLDDTNVFVTVPAGNFKTFEIVMYVKNATGEGLKREKFYTNYAKNIGIVRKQIGWLTDPNIYEYRLIRYKVD